MISPLGNIPDLPVWFMLRFLPLPSPFPDCSWLTLTKQLDSLAVIQWEQAKMQVFALMAAAACPGQSRHALPHLSRAGGCCFFPLLYLLGLSAEQLAFTILRRAGIADCGLAVSYSIYSHHCCFNTCNPAEMAQIVSTPMLKTHVSSTVAPFGFVL